MKVFYDTVIFMVSLNSRDKDYLACAKLLDIRSISWVVVFSSITKAESTILEYLNELIVRFSSHGIDWVEIEIDQIKKTIKENRSVYKELERKGVPSRDNKQLFAAFSRQTKYFITRDDHFIEPSKKHRGKKQDSVVDIIGKKLHINVVFPSRASSELIN